MVRNHKVFYPLYTDDDHFIFLLTGGRGPGKSFAVSDFIGRLTFEMNRGKDAKALVHQILYTRYTMVSANISIIPEFLEKMEAEGIEDYFHTTKTDVVNKATGSHVMFRGIKTSSGNQTAKLKSIHGITTFVVDEAEEWVSEREFETIMLSIRQKGIRCRIIIVMNPTDSNHWVYKRFIENTHRTEYIDGVPVQISTHPSVCHIHSTYLDNIENLSDEFLREVEDMKINNPEKYAHQVIGQWADVAEGAVFKNWGVVDEFPTNCKHVALASDWGYTNDPSTGIRCGIVDNRLYVDELFYRTGMLTNEIANEFRPWNMKVFADSADPRLIQEIHNRGVKVYPVDKYPGSVVAGIDKIKEYELFVTKRSYHIMEELRKYVWDKDMNGNYINEPIDAWNHCIDPIRYYILGCILGRILRPKNDVLTAFGH